MKTFLDIVSIVLIAVILTLVLAAVLGQPALAMPLVEPLGEAEIVDDVIMPPTGTGKYFICVDEANVYGGPDSSRMVRYTLPRGTEVNVRERAKWVLEGWAMIRPAYWVYSQDICGQ